jgi:hypothetical protein
METARRVLPVVVASLLLYISLASALIAPFAQSGQGVLDNLDLSIQGNALDFATLVQQADQIVRGRVVSTHSFWNERHTQIDSENVIAVRYTVFGAAKEQVIVRTEGGYLAAEDLGMKSTNTAAFALGEEVLIFLETTNQGDAVIASAAGKYTVLSGLAVNATLREEWPLSDLFAAIHATLAAQGRFAVLPPDWQQRETEVGTAGMLRDEDFVYEDLRWDGVDPMIRLKINVNTDEAGGSDGSVNDFRDAIINAARTWSVVPNAALGLLYDGTTTATDTSYNGVNEVMFFTLTNSNVAGRTRLWFNQSRTILEADFWLNNTMDWDTTGSPFGAELDVESAALHEFGHWLGLGHDSDSGAVMYASLTSGTTKRTLHANDIAGISFIYPCATVPCIPPEYATPATTPTLTPTPTPSATRTSTPTNTGVAPGTNTPTTTATPTVTLTASPTGSLTPTGDPVTTRTPTPTLVVTATVTATTTLVPTTQPGAARVYLPLVQK